MTQSKSFGQSIVPLGDAVWIEVGGIDVILNSVRSQVFTQTFFPTLESTLRVRKTLIVKSTTIFTMHFLGFRKIFYTLQWMAPIPTTQDQLL